MTILFGDFTDVLGDVVPGYVEIRPKEIRPARQGTSVIVDKTVRVPLASGAFRTGEIDPGVVVVTLHSGTGHGRVHESWEVHLPETGEMNLRDHVADRVTYSPEVVGQARAAATTAARYAGVAQEAAGNAMSAESRVDAVVSDGVATLKQHVATEVDAARAAREGAETARAGAETALQATTDARDATATMQGTVAGYVASTAEQVNVAKGHADRAETAASTAAAKAGEAATSATAAAQSATTAGDILVQVTSGREATETARDAANADRVGAEAARDEAMEAAGRAEGEAAGAAEDAAAAVAAAGRAEAAAGDAEESAGSAGESSALSADAAAVAVAASVATMTYTGSGSPEGKVTAPVGAVYVDRLVTAGAVRWVKYSGTGDTGWRVADGDTGDRHIQELISPGLVADVTRLRRIGSTVTLYVQVRLEDWPSPATMLRLPEGFRATGSLYLPQPYGQAGGIVTTGSAGTFTLHSTRNPQNAAPTFRWSWSWPTNDPWPTALPGVPIN